MIEKFFYLLVLSLPFSFALNPKEGIDLSFVRVLIVLLFFFWLAKSLAQKELLIDKRPRFWLWIMFFIFGLEFLLFGPFLPKGLFEKASFFSLLLLYYFSPLLSPTKIKKGF